MKVELRIKDIWQLLNGVLCVYKPRDLSLTTLKKRIVERIVEDGNRLDQPAVPMIEMPIIEPHPVSQALVVVGKRKQLDYSQHPLMVGRAFRPEDIMIEEMNDLEITSSGVCLFAIGPECCDIEEIKRKAWINSYRVEGKLGEETEENKIRGKVLLKAEYGGFKPSTDLYEVDYRSCDETQDGEIINKDQSAIQKNVFQIG